MAPRLRSLARLLPAFVLGLWAVTATAGDLPQSQNFPAIFGTQAVFRPDSAMLVQWNAMLQRFKAEQSDPSQIPAKWSALVNELKGLSLEDKVERVNAEIDRYRYVPAIVNWGKFEYWETPFEFLQRSGQCEDYAITKFMLLRAAGVSNDLMRIVVVYDKDLRMGHAVLVVNVNEQPLVLDNLTRRIRSTDSISQYRALYAINETGWWLMVPPSNVAQATPVS